MWTIFSMQEDDFIKAIHQNTSGKRIYVELGVLKQ
jgi:hypothetical protein